MADRFAVLGQAERDRLSAASNPPRAKPMLATLTHDPFSDESWIFEQKLDGVRCLCYRDGTDCHLVSRNEKRMDSSYPELVDAFASQPTERFVVDGEIVAFDDQGLTSFARLQHRIHLQDPDQARATGVDVYIYVFDCLWLDGHDTTGLGLRSRKRLLADGLSFQSPIFYSDHRDTRGEQYFDEACKKRWEGLIAKRADSRYVYGRSRDWLKFKCTRGQEFVIGGYTDPKGARERFGALLVGYYRDGDLVYAGKVGTGFDQQTLDRLGDQLASRERSSAPFANARSLPRDGVHWVSPKLVAEVDFTEWTQDGRLRHPRYLGLRDDKRAEDVVREQ